MERRCEPRGRGAAGLGRHGRPTHGRGETADVPRARQCLMTLARRVGWSFRRTRAAGGKPVGSNPHPGAHINLEPRTAPFSRRLRDSVLDRAGLLARRLPLPPTFPSARLSGVMADSSGLQQRGLRRNGRSRGASDVTGLPVSPRHMKIGRGTRIECGAKDRRSGCGNASAPRRTRCARHGMGAGLPARVAGTDPFFRGQAPSTGRMRGVNAASASCLVPEGKYTVSARATAPKPLGRRGGGANPGAGVQPRRARSFSACRHPAWRRTGPRAAADGAAAHGRRCLPGDGWRTARGCRRPRRGGRAWRGW